MAHLKVDDAAVDTLVGFLEVATHELLYRYSVYPADLYDKWKKFEVPVHICRHRRVIEYVQSVLASCRPWIVQGRVESMSVAVRSTKTGALLTTCVFELRMLLISAKDDAKDQLDELFRRSLVQLSAAAAAHAFDGNDERIFRMYLRTSEEATVPETLVCEHDIQQSWILATPADAMDDRGSAHASIVPIASSSRPSLPLHLNVYLVQPESSGASPSP
ncbi:hypothetical protein, variant 1 [Aphanomyces invadans]|uniref:HORMA domain-containing protein n=1 Tax=Aphanomyces invadans TaxID=157072 RepID=A0A024TSR4_9STRA|nr:hypothetical protein, variant 1 [Aphanomyces invadans]ETV96367.1 hypothetical protein, variant 1 [Aphanomyces invadans]|eukprot:XP_008875159.1 hypothetical protein, variant 1 [Aphanomyces invadans]